MVFLIMDRTMKEHECPWPTYHIEVPNRLEVIINRFEKTNLSSDPLIKNIETRLASKDEIEIVHTQRYIEDIEKSQELTVEQQEELCTKYEDIYLNKQSWKCARMAAAASIDLVTKVVENKENGLALVRPPGHHAMPDKGCGFCIFNNVAIAAKHARKNGCERVLIVDFDVHAGQGTQECIEDDENIKLISIHRYELGEFWPNLEQSGLFHKFKNTLNVPLNGVGFTDSDYVKIFICLVLPIISDWKPDLIIVSCGFDAALGDPEGYMNLTPAGYATLIKMLINTNIPLAAILEGGYFLDSIASDAEWVLRTLLNQNVPKIIIDTKETREPLRKVIKIVLETHQNEFSSFKDILNLLKIKADTYDDDYFGERNVCEPYETRGLYIPFTEEKVEKFRRELEEIVKNYEKNEEYQLKAIQKADENFKIREGILYTNNYFVALTIGLTQNPLLAIPDGLSKSHQSQDIIENILKL
ncbi:unnamed protein product [Caenorhabditis angaria]|uniref:Histone deacetylase domain-containing protein n=1 Tax=Caenorhabditis angaria TaxID=860376 RepID=A0A9P1MWJ6_9PELO|nr:unnamed protein product [Caenorhabditis angaria]